jgi:hypothetical protein
MHNIMVAFWHQGSSKMCNRVEFHTNEDVGFRIELHRIRNVP